MWLLMHSFNLLITVVMVTVFTDAKGTWDGGWAGTRAFLSANKSVWIQFKDAKRALGVSRHADFPQINLWSVNQILHALQSDSSIPVKRLWEYETQGAGECSCFCYCFKCSNLIELCAASCEVWKMILLCFELVSSLLHLLNVFIILTGVETFLNEFPFTRL